MRCNLRQPCKSVHPRRQSILPQRQLPQCQPPLSHGLSNLTQTSEARSRIPQTKLSHGRRYDCHATTRTKSRLSQFSLGQIAHSSVLPDLRLLSERLLFYCIFCFYPVHIALRIRREWIHGRFLLASNIHTHIHTLPSKRWVVRMCCIYFKMAEASRPGIGYTYRLIFSNFVYRPLDCGGVLGLVFGAGRWLLLGESKLRHWYRPLGNCEVGLARSFFRMTATAYLVSLSFHDLGGSAHSGLLACEGAGWYRAHCMSLISGPTPDENTTTSATNRTEPNTYVSYPQKTAHPACSPVLEEYRRVHLSSSPASTLSFSHQKPLIRNEPSQNTRISRTGLPENPNDLTSVTKVPRLEV
jgi:hypothetical protein